MKLTHALHAFAAASLALAPVAAQAGTKASSSSLGIASAPLSVNAAGKRKSSSVAVENNISPGIIILIIALGLGVAGAAGAFDGGNGTNGS